MPYFLKFLRLIFLLVLAWASTPVLAIDCFNLTQPSKPVFSKQGSTNFATYTVTGSVINLANGENCNLLITTISGSLTFGYTFPIKDTKFTNVSSNLATCTPSESNFRTLVFTQKAVGVCAVAFNMVFPFTGSYDGSNPLTDIIFKPILASRASRPVSNTVFETITNRITVPPEPARTCSLTQPGIVTMADRKPSDFPNVASLSLAGSFSVTLGCPPTTSARSGTPSLIFSYPTTFVAFTCSATNQADPAVASPVLAVISRLSDNTLVCGTSAVSSSVQNFASFNGTGAYTSTLDFKTFYISQKANPGPGVFTASITLQVQYP